MSPGLRLRPPASRNRMEKISPWELVAELRLHRGLHHMQPHEICRTRRHLRARHTPMTRRSAPASVEQHAVRFGHHALSGIGEPAITDIRPKADSSSGKPAQSAQNAKIGHFGLYLETNFAVCPTAVNTAIAAISKSSAGSAMDSQNRLGKSCAPYPGRAPPR